MHKYMCRKACQGSGDVEHTIDLAEIIHEAKEMKGGTGSHNVGFIQSL